MKAIEKERRSRKKNRKRNLESFIMSLKFVQTNLN